MRIEEQYLFRDEESFHIDLNSELITLPKNGICKLSYLNGNTAIQGTMNDGSKEGEWVLYKESGEVACKKYFEADELKRTVVYFHMRDNPLESRAYYISPNASIQSFELPVLQHSGDLDHIFLHRQT